MSNNRTILYNNTTSPRNYNRLPDALRAAAAERKYSSALDLYATSDLTVRKVAELSGVTAAGLSAHIARNHRPLLYARYGMDFAGATELKVKAPKGQSLKTHLKYKEAIEACGDMAYIEYNVSEIARMFGLSGNALAAQLRVHYPDVIPAREEQRQQLGLADNVRRGARQSSVEDYGEAVAMYRDTDLTISEVAGRCDVSPGGLSRYMRFYHKDVIEAKAARRAEAPADRRAGLLSGNGQLYGPKAGTVAYYARALELYRTTAMTVDEIAAAAAVPAEGFRAYLGQWHRDDMLRRRGVEWDGEGTPDLASVPRYRRSTAGKYADAIDSLRANPRPVAEVAADFGLNPEVFRKYLRTHAPGLASEQGMVRLGNGRLVKRSSYEKYRDAVDEYAASADSLKDIARRRGLVYTSLAAYVSRNCPDDIARHEQAVASVAGARDNNDNKGIA